MILLTGFEGYGGRTKNPSQAIVEALDGMTIKGLQVHSEELPVDYQALKQAAPALLDKYHPKVAIAFGLWPGEAAIRLERIGKNCADFEIPDNTGKMRSERVRPKGMDAHFTTLPIHKIRDRLLAAGIPARLSGSAGTFLCNVLTYSLLAHCHERQLETRCGFIHVPYLPAQAAQMLTELIESQSLEYHQRADVASMSLELMIEAAKLSIEVTLDEMV